LVGYVTPLEIQNAENYWIRKAQQESFSTEIYQLSNGRQIAANKLQDAFKILIYQNTRNIQYFCQINILLPPQ
ncbi:hypothetical protein T01_9314, partial [Trichinella spiralis]